MGLIKTLRNIRNGVISAIPLLPNYTQTQYVDDNIPALESKNLNKAEKQLVTLTNQINANIGTLNTLITNSNANIDKVQKLNSNGDFSQNVSLNGSKIYNSGTPTNDSDLATVKYVKDNAGSETRVILLNNVSKTINNDSSGHFIIPSGIDLSKYKDIELTVYGGSSHYRQKNFYKTFGDPPIFHFSFFPTQISRYLSTSVYTSKVIVYNKTTYDTTYIVTLIATKI